MLASQEERSASTRAAMASRWRGRSRAQSCSRSPGASGNEGISVSDSGSAARHRRRADRAAGRLALERTHLLITTEKVFVVDGTIRRRASAVRLRTVENLGLEQSLLGRLLGYGRSSPVRYTSSMCPSQKRLPPGRTPGQLMAEPKAPPLEVRGLTKRFGSTTAVDDLSFSVEPGCITGFLGPNGAGKTTTLRTLLGLIRPSSGEALVTGVPYRKLGGPIRTVGAVLEASSYHPGRSGPEPPARARDGRRHPAGASRGSLAVRGADRRRDRRVGGYSLGMRQRLGVAGALLGEPACSSSTSRPTGSTPRGSAGCGTSCAPSRTTAAPSSSRATSSRRSHSSRTRS